MFEHSASIGIQRLGGDIGDEFGLDAEAEDVLDECISEVGVPVPTARSSDDIVDDIDALDTKDNNVELQESHVALPVQDAVIFTPPPQTIDSDPTETLGPSEDLEETQNDEDVQNQEAARPRWLSAALTVAAREWAPAVANTPPRDMQMNEQVTDSESSSEEPDLEYSRDDPAWSGWSLDPDKPGWTQEEEDPEPEPEALVQGGQVAKPAHANRTPKLIIKDPRRPQQQRPSRTQGKPRDVQDTCPRRGKPRDVKDTCPRRPDSGDSMESMDHDMSHETSSDSQRSSMPISRTLPKLEWQVLYFTGGLLLLWMCVHSWLADLDPDYRAIDFSTLWYLRIYDVFNMCVFFSVRCLVRSHGVRFTKKVLALMMFSRFMGWVLLCVQAATVEVCFEEASCMQKVVSLAIVTLGHLPIMYVLLRSEAHARMAAGFAGLTFLVGGFGLTELRLAPVTIAGVVFLAFWGFFQIKSLMRKRNPRPSSSDSAADQS